MSWQGRSWQDTIETTVRGLGYDVVDAERSVGGLLRVTIDHPAPAPGADERAITVDDCEAVTRQLQHVLEVEGVDYQRLEVSSPGLDRPLKRAVDYARFAGHEVELALKAPLQGRKRYRGVLEAAGERWRLVLPAAKGGEPQQALDFTLDEVREARLVPVIDFKGRRGRTPQAGDASHAPAGREAALAAAPAGAEDDGGRLP